MCERSDTTEVRIGHAGGCSTLFVRRVQAERYLNHPGEIAAFATKDLQSAICSCPLSDKQMNIAMGGAGMWGG